MRCIKSICRPGSEVIKIIGNNAEKINNAGLSWALNTVRFIPGRKYFIGGDGFYTAKHLGNEWIHDNSMPPYYKTGIRGSNFNDIVISGAYGLLMHYNGVSWKNYQDITYMNSGAFGRVEIKDNIMAATGGEGNKAIILIGRR